MTVTVRLENEQDYKAVENLTREAFWDIYRPGCCEHLVAHKIRQSAAFVKELSYVACDGPEIIGNIIFSKAKAVSSDNTEFEVLALGPVAVLPCRQKKGTGTLLINTGLKKAKELGFKAVILFGNPLYYRRFGFTNAKTYAITTSAGDNFDAFMALELFPRSLEGVTGGYYQDNAFDIDDRELDSFEKNFPPREKHVTDTQLK